MPRGHDAWLVEEAGPAFIRFLLATSRKLMPGMAQRAHAQERRPQFLFPRMQRHRSSELDWCRPAQDLARYRTLSPV
jgi:hypothetical protein